MKINLILGATAIALIVATAALSKIGSDIKVDDKAVPHAGTVVKVVDGDTFDIRHGNQTSRIRIIGVDTPETHTPTHVPNCYGTVAADLSTKLLLGHRVRLSFQVEKHDIYGRVLADVQTDSGVDVGAMLIKTGSARTLSIPPNNTRAAYLSTLQLSARTGGLGLWGKCGFHRSFPDKQP